MSSLNAKGKKKILMIPSWYPTNSDPIGGSFFREQAIALEERFEFLVAIVRFERLSIRSAILRVLQGRGLRPGVECHDYQQPPRAFLFTGFGFGLGKLRYLLPYSFIDRALDSLNDRREKRLYLSALSYASETLAFKPDLLYAMTAQVNAIQVSDLGKAAGLPVVVAEHVPFCIDSIPESRRGRLRTALEDVSALLTVSNDKSRQVLMGNIDCDPIVVGNMVDERCFTLKPDSKSDTFKILIVAAYNFYKDYKTFFKSMAILRELTKRPFRITIVGIEMFKTRGAWSLGMDDFWKAFKPFGLDDITTIVGFVPRDKIVGYYHGADAYVLTSIQEGLPVSVLEAMACGLPIFSTRCGGVEDIVGPESGRVLPVRDCDGIAEALRDFFEGRTSFDKNRIRENVVRRYGREAFVVRMERVFDECMACSRQNREERG
jgi:glycosyltransferase involved in cell wall biosynthesis